MPDELGTPRRVDGISVVVPAWNAAATIEETLASLRAQTRQDWEAIVVDDGSTDQTVAIVERIAATDPRIRLVRQANAGAAAARNRGVEHASHGWLLFLDADDWILPEHLSRLSEVLEESPDAHAAVCGWTLVRNGMPTESEYCHASGDLFAVLARRPAFAIHACLIDRRRVEAVSGFDVRFRVLQDWVLWQRIARTGARFAVIADALAVYRLHDRSLTADQHRLTKEALDVIALGHGPDPAVEAPDPRHATGRPRHELTEAQLLHTAWAAGIELARGRDARPLLDGIASGTAPGAAEHIGTILSRAAVSARPPDDITEPARYAETSRRLGLLLASMNEIAGDAELPRAATIDFERHLLGGVSRAPRDRSLSLVQSATVEITEPIVDLPAAPGIERLRIHVLVEGDALGWVERPVIGGLVRSAIVADAIVERFAWDILGRFFSHTLYSSWAMRAGENGWTAWRGEARMCAGLPEDPTARLRALHDTVGWSVFLEEIAKADSAPWWKRMLALAKGRASRRSEMAGIELGELDPGPSASRVVLRAGGAVIGVVEEEKTWRPDRRARLADAAGFESCRVVVREALLGAPLRGGTLASRLQNAARRRQRLTTTSSRWADDSGIAPFTAEVAGCLASAEANGIAAVLSRYPDAALGSSASRTADLPADAHDAVRELASALGLPLFRATSAGAAPRTAYDPNLLGVLPPLTERRVRQEDTATIPRASAHGRHHFERLFAEHANPWGYDTPYERTKYEETLSLLPARAERALELACAEGHFTVMLAPRARELVAADISEIALQRVAGRCARAGLTNVTTRRLDLTADALPGGQDLILCCEVLYFMSDRDTLAAVARRIAGALAEGGALVIAHAHLLSDDPEAPGFDWGLPFGARTIGETFASLSELVLEREIRTPLYRIQRFRRRSSRETPAAPVIEERPNAVLPEGRTTTGLRLTGSSTPMPVATAATTSRLPILMYHRVAAHVRAERRRYAVEPAQLEEQLAYLRDVGFASVSLEEWRSAVTARRALPGRRVMITFDDAYDDFGAAAWPLLMRYGFSAMLFVVTGSVGARNHWDLAGADERLLDWDALRGLAREGVTLGSHTVSHPRLSAQPPRRIVEEAARSRVAMLERLGAAPAAIAYPWGGSDETVQHLAGACGYTAGFTTRAECAGPNHSLMALPRLEVRGDGTLRDFIALLDT